jgi:hypothetical protein
MKQLGLYLDGNLRGLGASNGARLLDCNIDCEAVARSTSGFAVVHPQSLVTRKQFPRQARVPSLC